MSVGLLLGLTAGLLCTDRRRNIAAQTSPNHFIACNLQYGMALQEQEQQDEQQQQQLLLQGQSSTCIVLSVALGILDVG